jgi:hypothetical protein
MHRTKQFIQLLSLSGFIFILSIQNASGIGNVEQLRSTTHEINQPSKVTQIHLTWQIPSGYTQVNGYYYLFDNNATHTFTELNTAGVSFGNYYDTSSPDYTNVDDKAYYFHIAAEDISEIIGPTSTLGPFRIDTIAPKNALVNAKDVIFDDALTLILGATGAREMYISNIAYGTGGTWETYNTSRQWNVTQERGIKTIYVQFRDEAGNIAKCSTTTRIAYQKIALHKGWNLISYATDRCFYVGTRPNISWINDIVYEQVIDIGEVFKSIANTFSIVHGFYTEAQTYNPLNPIASNMKYIAPGYGYWIKVKDSVPFDGNGCIYLEVGGKKLDNNYSIPLNSGWNLIGYTGENVRYTGSIPNAPFPDDPEKTRVTNLLDASFCSINEDLLIVQGFDTEPRALNPENAIASNMNYVGPGYGYWIKIKTESQNVQMDWNACR